MSKSIIQHLRQYAGKDRQQVRNPCITAREAIVIADHIDQLERRLGLLPERRLQLEVRAQVDYLIGAGYQIVSRDPLRLERGRWVAELQDGEIKTWREHQ